MISSAQLEDPLEHHRDDDERGALVLGDGVERALGVDLRRSTSVEPSAMPSVKCAKPHEWNIGAAICVFSRARSGIFENSAAAGSSDSGCLRLAPFGRAGRAAGEDDDAALLRRRLEVATRRRGDEVLEQRVAVRVLAVAPGDEALAAPRARPRRARRTPRRRRCATGFSRSQTSVICGPANIVLRYSALAPSFEQRDRGVDEAAVVAAHDRDAVALLDALVARARGRARWSAGGPPRRSACRARR